MSSPPVPPDVGSTALIPHPEISSRRARIDALREELTRAFEERIRLGFEHLPRLRDRYSELFGDLERTIQQKTLEHAERRRVVELVALKLDRGQKIDDRTLELIARAARNEFARIRGRLQKGERSAGAADPPLREPGYGAPVTGTGSGPRSRAEELRELYRLLVRRLHPDAPGSHFGGGGRYWELLQRGYERGDIPLLRTLAHVVTMVDDEAPEVGRLAPLERRLQNALRAERAHLESMGELDILGMEEGMQDEEWIRHRRYELQQEITEIEQRVADCDRFLRSALGGRRIPPPPNPRGSDPFGSFVEDVYINNR